MARLLKRMAEPLALLDKRCFRDPRYTSVMAGATSSTVGGTACRSQSESRIRVTCGFSVLVLARVMEVAVRVMKR